MEWLEEGEFDEESDEASLRPSLLCIALPDGLFKKGREGSVKAMI